MQRIGNQPNAKNQFENDCRSCSQKRKIEAEKMITINVNLEPVHVDDLQNGGNDEHKAQQDLQGRFTDRGCQNGLFRIVAVAKQVFPPTGLLSSHLILRNFRANHLPPTHDFLRLVGTR